MHKTDQLQSWFQHRATVDSDVHRPEKCQLHRMQQQAQRTLDLIQSIVYCIAYQKKSIYIYIYIDFF